MYDKGEGFFRDGDYKYTDKNRVGGPELNLQ